MEPTSSSGRASASRGCRPTDETLSVRLRSRPFASVPAFGCLTVGAAAVRPVWRGPFSGLHAERAGHLGDSERRRHCQRQAFRGQQPCAQPARRPTRAPPADLPIPGYAEETNRNAVSEDVDERTLFEMYLPPFEGAIKAGLGSVMCSCESPRARSISAAQLWLASVRADGTLPAVWWPFR